MDTLPYINITENVALNEASNSGPRTSKNITNEKDIQELLQISENDITTSLIMELFGEFNEKQRFHPYDTFTVPPKSYGVEGHMNKGYFTTTVGLWIFNKYMIEQDLCKQVGYINYEVNSKKWDKLVDKITRCIMEDELEVTAIDRLLQKSQKLMPMCTVLTPSITEKFLNISKYVEPKKKELAKKYAKEIEAGDVLIAEKMEKELIAYAMEYLKDDPSLDIYLSGARSSISNHFKNMYIMKGAIRNPDPNAEKEFDIALSCYNDGISKEEYALFCNSLSAGPYSRAKKTEVGGYWEKLFTSAFQHLQLGAVGSDCGTKDTIEELLTDSNIDFWMYSFIADPSKGLVELNSKNMNSYLNKRVQFRFSSLCEAKDGFCNHCIGNLFYKLDKQNIGVTMSVICSILKNKSMKAFHNSSVQLTTMDVKKAFGE